MRTTFSRISGMKDLALVDLSSTEST